MLSAVNRLEAEVASVWEELFDAGPLGADADFFAMGGTSLMALRMIDAIEERLHRTLPLDALLAGSTIARVAHALAQVQPAGRSSLVRFRPGRGRPPLICLHSAGGSALCYLELARRLHPDQPAFGLQEPDGLSEREPSIEDRAAAYLAEIVDAGPDGPWHLAGHSFGGLVAFEIARRLAAAGRPPAAVALIDTVAPAIDGARLEDDQVRRLAAALEGGALDDEVPSNPEDERRMWEALARFAGDSIADGSRLGAIQRFCQRFHFLPSGPGMGYVELRRFLRAMRGAFRSASRYEPAPYDGRVTLFQADGDARWKRVQIERWSALARGGLEVCPVPGGHLDLLGPPHVDVLAARLTEVLNRAGAA